MAKKRILWLVLITGLAAFRAGAQDWKQVYNEAIALYNNQQYPDAYSKAKQAYSLSKSLDAKNQAYSLQLMTSICLDGDQINEGLSWISEEEGLFEKVEGPASMPYAEALRKHGLLLTQKGSFAEARKKCEASLAVMKGARQENSQVYATLLSQDGQLAALLGDLTGARDILNQSLTMLATFPDAGDDLVNTLTVAAGVERQLKDFPAAEKKYRRLLPILAQNGLQQSPAYADASAALADVLRQQGNVAESATALGQGAASQRAVQYLKIGVDYHNQKQYDKALEAYANAEKAAAEDHLENNTAFSIYLNYGKALLETSQLMPATEQLQKASKLCKKLYPVGSIEFVLLDFSLGDLNMSQYQTARAAEYYMHAAAGAGSLPAGTRKQIAVHTATTLLNGYQSEIASRFLLALGVDKIDGQAVRDQPELILLYAQGLLQSGNVLAAEKVIQDALALPNAPSTQTKFEFARTQILVRKGSLPQALALLQQIQQRSSAGEEEKQEATYQAARVQQLMGRYQDAEKGFRIVVQALSARPGQKQLLLQASNSLAVLQTQLGNYDEAERLYTDLLKQKDLSVDFELTVKQNLATIYEESFQFAKAGALLEQVTAEERARRSAQDPVLAITLQNLATLYQKTGNLAGAQKLLEEAIRIDQSSGGEAGGAYATKLANLGVVQQQLGNLTEARKLFQEALRVHELTVGKEHPDYMFNAYNLAVLLQQADEVASAMPLFREISIFYRRQILELFPAMSEREKAAYYNKINPIIVAYLDFAISNCGKFPQLLGELYDFRLCTKALLYNASAKIRNTILASGDTLLQARYSEWQGTKEDLGKLILLGAQDRARAEDRMLSLRQRANELEKFLSEKSLSFYQDTQGGTVDWKKVKSSLKKGQAAVEIIRLKLNLKNDSVVYAALVLRPESATPEIVMFPDGRQMEGREFNYYRNCVKYLTHNARSYNLFWKPLEQKLPGVQTVFLSSDGIYNKVNVTTLRDPLSGKYLVEMARIKLVNNTRELVMSAPQTTHDRKASLFGRPDFVGGARAGTDPKTNDDPTELESLVISGVADLPGTEEEVTKIAALLRDRQWQSETFLGAQSTETALKNQKGISVLHIATHGFFIPAETDKEQIMLAPDMRQSAKNPLLRSGLILAGAQKSMQANRASRNFSEDGILTAYEVMNLNLDHAELVVLSACETGAGEIRNGEGIFGLQRAFLLAGAGSLVMSLWKVDDEATQELMVEFYRKWAETGDKYEAFHQAMLTMKSRLVEPYYWGAFAMIGVN